MSESSTRDRALARARGLVAAIVLAGVAAPGLAQDAPPAAPPVAA